MPTKMMMEHITQVVQAKLADGEALQVPAWVSVALVVLAILFVYTQISITYTHGSLVATLAMVEDASPTAILVHSAQPADPSSEAPPPYADAADDNENTPLTKQSASLPAWQDEILMVPRRPITSSNRGTVKHLKQMGGRGSRFRGMGVALLHGLLTHWISNLIFYFVDGRVGAALGFVVSQMLLYRLNLLWTHIVISAPSSKRWYRRFVPRHVAKRAALPTLAWAGVHLLLSFVVLTLTDALKLDAHLQPDGEKRKMMCAAKGVVLASVSMALLVFVYLPVNVALTRVQAALLSEEEQPIVPMDRSFGGVTSLELPRWRLSGAWSTFDWNGRVRLIKVYLRTGLYMVLSSMFFVASGLVVLAVWALLADVKIPKDKLGGSLFN